MTHAGNPHRHMAHCSTRPRLPTTPPTAVAIMHRMPTTRRQRVAAMSLHGITLLNDGGPEQAAACLHTSRTVPASQPVPPNRVFTARPHILLASVPLPCVPMHLVPVQSQPPYPWCLLPFPPLPWPLPHSPGPPQASFLASSLSPHLQAQCISCTALSAARRLLHHTYPAAPAITAATPRPARRPASSAVRRGSVGARPSGAACCWPEGGGAYRLVTASSVERMGGLTRNWACAGWGRGAAVREGWDNAVGCEALWTSAQEAAGERHRTGAITGCTGPQMGGDWKQAGQV